ncbi:aminoglycoside phosphotransferase family protein [Paenibacillus sp. y28]|uniref:aminoglycoside phosphotransferase family protein n=1 Tax=Paenibacillus sp. y28 TaxID=3129110 RepID=UPI003016D1CB
MDLPNSFIQTVTGVHGPKGRQWLQTLDGLIRYCELKWDCTVQEPYELSYHFVVPAAGRDGTETVLKLGVPSNEQQTEIAALRLYNGSGAVRLLDAEPERGILALERLLPGQTLKSVTDDEEAAMIAASVMKRLRVTAPAAAGFPTTAAWAEGLAQIRGRFNGGTGPMPEKMVEAAEQLYRQLVAGARPVQLLHGDLHHGNILYDGSRGWLAIDPKGVIGEAEYQVIPFLMNHLPDEGRTAIMERRIAIFVEQLQLDRGRVLAWAYCHAILSAWWHVESQTDGMEASLRTAEQFAAMLKAL